MEGKVGGVKGREVEGMGGRRTGWEGRVDQGMGREG